MGSTRNSRATGRGRKPPQGFRRERALPPLLSRPDGRVGENRENTGRTARNLGASARSLLNVLQARFTGEEPGVLSPRASLKTQDLISAQDSGLLMPGLDDSDSSGSWNPFLLGSENTLDRFSGTPKGNYGPRPSTGQYPCE